MMWHFYEIPYIPDLELVKYQSLGEQGIDGILERHNRFLRQWQRNTVLIHTTLHFFLSYTHERPKGSRLQIFLAFSSDQTVNFESIDALMQASPLADYYKIAPIEDVPVCLRKSFTNILLVKKQEQTRLSTGDTLFTVEGWKSNPKSRLYEMEKTAEALNEDMVYHISIYGSDTYKTAQQALQKPIAILREKALGRSGQITLADNKNRPRDVSAEETLRIYEEFLSDVAKSTCFFANILLYANQKSSAHFLMDAVCGEAIKEGTCEIQEIPSTATPLELQEVNQPYCNLLPPSLAFWPTAYTLDELSSFFRLPILFDGENIEIKKETAPKLEQTGIYLGQTNNGLSAFIDASSFKKHAFICGVPGSGKTNTMLHLANSLWHHKKLIKDDTDNLSVTFKEESDPIPFLVLEPAKREYRELSRYDIPELIILSPSASTKFPMRLNPFEFPKGLTLSEHISKLCQVFEGAFPIAPPAPFILDKAIEGIYRAHGWNTNDINTGEKEYPTMSELYDRFQKELSQTTYDSEIQGNIQSVLEMRIGSLLRREMKDIFDVKHSTFSPEEWLKHPVIVELESLGEGPANFVTLLLCTLIRETLKASPRADEEKVVRHIIFIEEAHNLIAPEAQVASGQDSNPKIAATAYIVKMLAEVRALREGIIIADQLPTAMAPEVIKNTNIKLIHRLTSIDDRQLIGSTMSASGIQLEHVAVYRPGEALMSYEGLQRPFELRIQEQKGHGSETPNDDELYDIMLHKPAFFQLAQKEENLKLETLKENVKSLKKKEVEALCALSEYDSSVHTSTQITDFYWHMENIYTSIVILRSQYRRDCQAINELFISAERKAMLDELIRSIGESLQQKIKNNVVFLDSNGQLE